MFKRINEQGEFEPCRGVTIISKTVPAQQELWAQLYKLLSTSPLIKKNYGLLPHTSYHMTTNNLFTEEEQISPNWSFFIDENLEFFQSICDTLARNQAHFNPITAKVTGVITQPVIQLVVEISASTKQQLDKIANDLDISQLQPSFLHLTLAYQYKDTSFSEDTEVWNFITTAVEEVFGANPSFALQPPKLCYFHDMTAFHHWKTLKNPFTADGFLTSRKKTVEENNRVSIEPHLKSSE